MKQSKAVSSNQYWAKIRLPLVFDELNMQQLTALRLMVQKAFNEGKKMPTLETKKIYEFLKDNYIEVPTNAKGFLIKGEIDSQLEITWITFAKLSVIEDCTDAS